MTTLKNIAQQIQKVLSKEIGSTVEVTFCRDNILSVFGSVEAVHKAESFIKTHSQRMKLTHESTESYTEEDEACAFFKF